MLAAVAASASPAAAEDPPPTGKVTRITTAQGGGPTAGGDGIKVNAGARGSGGGGGGSIHACDWQPVWPTGGGATTTVNVPTFFSPFAALINFFSPTNTTGQPSTVELIPANEADKDNDGNPDPEYTVPLGSAPGDDVIGEVKNVSPFNEVLINLFGTTDLGVFQPNPALDGIPVDKLTPKEQEGAVFVNNSHFPLIKRGTDPFTGDDLWWVPWFVAPKDQKDGCPAGLVYSPQTANPRVVLPDLQDFVTRMLPPAQPVIKPLDKVNHWAYVQVATNFAVAGASLTPQSAHAEVDYILGPGNVGTVWAQIDAFPTHLIYSPGDGSSPVVCPLSQMRYDPANPGACSHIYLDSSAARAGGVFRATLSVAWVGRYSDSTGLVRFINLNPRIVSFDVPVAEARPVNQTSNR